MMRMFDRISWKTLIIIMGVLLIIKVAMGV